MLDRRLFLRSIGKWSGAAIAAAVVGGVWLASPPEANAGGWVNSRGGGGGWINGASHPGGSWVNGGAGGWVNRRGAGGALGQSLIRNWGHSSVRKIVVVDELERLPFASNTPKSESMVKALAPA